MSGDALRLDKWLWHARFFKSRSLATKFCASRKLRVNTQITAKAHRALKVDDVLTFPKGPHIRVIKVLALGTRRGPASEAQTLYEDLAPPQLRAEKKQRLTNEAGRRDPGSGRPTKVQRRAIDRLKGR